jgi:ornithine cyclodeaminase
MIGLDGQQIAEILPLRRAIDWMRDAFRFISNGEAVSPLRLNLPIVDENANSLIMPSYVPGSDYFGIKTANVFPGNRNRDLPVIISQYQLYSA